MKNMFFGRALGIFFLFIGVLMGILGFIWMNNTDTILSLFLITPTFLLLGLAMIIFPGEKVTIRELNGDATFKEILKDKNKKNEQQKRQWQSLGRAPLLHKIVWGISFAAGIVITIIFVFKYTI